MEKLYLMSFGAQKEIVDNNCFNCGKIIVGGITFEGGMWFTCREHNCPIEEELLEIGECELTTGQNEFIIIRKLKEEYKENPYKWEKK